MYLIEVILMKTRTYRRYTFELKKQAVELYFEGYTAKEIVDRLDLGNVRRVYQWVTLVKEANTFDVLLPNKGLPRVKKDALKEENERLKLENLYLKKLLALRKE
jgi:transposase-like protein